MNLPRTKPVWRIQFLGLCMLLGLSALLARLWWVQVARGKEWTARIQSSSEATVRIPSIRGEIRDRNGVPLVQNRASYEVDFYLPEMVKGYRERYGRPPETQYRATISGMPKDMKEPDIVRIVNDGVVPRLDDLNLARDYNANQLQRHYRNNTEVPYSYIKDIDFGTMAKFSEHDVGLPGVDIAIKPVRSYVYGALASHLLGYVGAPDDTNLDEAKKYTFYQGDVEGKSNVEKAMDAYLRGQPGIRVMRRNAKGTIDGVIREEPPKQGANVYLTIDARIQTIAEEALRVVGRGAAVVVDPNNGNVLAMASVPSFDPNTFIPSIKAKDWNELRNDEAHPLINRAVSAFPPGSTFKLVTALAGSARTKIWPKRAYTCGGGVTYGDHFFQCWINEKGGQHGTPSLSDAIKVSCNSFFYQYGNAAGIDAIDDTGRRSVLANRPALESRRVVWRPAGAGVDADPPPNENAGLRPTRPMFPSARAMILRRPCKWRWLTQRSRTAEFHITRVSSIGFSIRTAHQRVTPAARSPFRRRPNSAPISGTNLLWSRSRSLGTVFGKWSTKTAAPAASRDWKTCRSRARPAPRRRC